MQVKKFSTFIIAFSVLTYLFGVVITFPIPTGGGSRHGSPVRTNSSPAISTGQVYSSRPSSPLHTQTQSSRPGSPVERQPTPKANAPPQTYQEYHKERAEKWTEHIKDTGDTAIHHGKNAIESVRKGNYMNAAIYLGDSCVMGMICGAGHVIKAVHNHKAKRPDP